MKPVLGSFTSFLSELVPSIFTFRPCCKTDMTVLVRVYITGIFSDIEVLSDGSLGKWPAWTCCFYVPVEKGVVTTGAFDPLMNVSKSFCLFLQLQSQNDGLGGFDTVSDGMPRSVRRLRMQSILIHYMYCMALRDCDKLELNCSTWSGKASNEMDYT